MMVGLKTLASALAAVFATGRAGEADHHGRKPEQGVQHDEMRGQTTEARRGEKCQSGAPSRLVPG